MALAMQSEKSTKNHTGKPQLLFVDDDERTLKLLKKVFEGCNYTCFFAQSGFAALAVLENEPIDVVASDMRMPKMTGNELLEIVKNKYPSVIRFAISGNFDVADAIAAINRGSVTNYVIKPFNFAELKLDIYKALASRKKRMHELNRLKESRKSAAQRARQAGLSTTQLKAMVDEIQTGFMTIIEGLNEKIEMSGERVLFRRQLSHVLAEAVPLNEKETVQLNTALFLASLSNKQCSEVIKALPKTSFLANSIALVSESYRTQFGIESTPVLDQSYIAIEELDRRINLEGHDWKHSIEEFNQAYSHFVPEVLLAINSAELQRLDTMSI